MAAALAIACVLAAAAPPAAAADASKETLWTNETEVSLVVTEGNSDVQTFGLKDTLTRTWKTNRFQLKLEGLRASNSDDWIAQVQPGVTWLPGETPPPSPTTVVKPEIELDNETYFAEGRFDRKIRGDLNWHAGASWDRNLDAGILSRTIVFAGVGNVWYKRDDLKFSTTYGLSETWRREETEDPEKEDQFVGARLSWAYLNKFGKVTTYTNDWTFNESLADFSDWSMDMTNAISVTMSKRLSLRVSLRWLYNSEPALEEIDIVAFVVIQDPDGIPGNGDEFLETVPSGGTEITVGETTARKEKLDQILKTTLVISF